jgi:hypothetical protein
MKKLIIITLFFAAGFLTTAHAKPLASVHGYNSYFYSALSPHGVWMEIDYGVVVWRPVNIRQSWAPYRNGQWLWTVDGWYWDSYEPYGYITYHYGRWYFDDYYGWLWIPDYEWAPAWVEWRYDDAYIGWAPLPPYAVFSINIGIRFTKTYYTPYSHWHYVKYRYFCDPYVYNYYVGPKQKYHVHAKTKYRTNYGYDNGRIVNRGVDINHVRTRSGQTIREREIIRVSNPRDIRNNSGERGNGRDAVRTFDVSRDVLIRGTENNVEITRSERKTSLEISKLGVGRNIENNDVKSINRDGNKKEVQIERSRTGEEKSKENERNLGTQRNVTPIKREKVNMPRETKQVEVKRRTTETNNSGSNNRTGNTQKNESLNRTNIERNNKQFEMQKKDEVKINSQRPQIIKNNPSNTNENRSGNNNTIRKERTEQKVNTTTAPPKRETTVSSPPRQERTQIKREESRNTTQRENRNSGNTQRKTTREGNKERR